MDAFSVYYGRVCCLVIVQVATCNTRMIDWIEFNTDELA